MARREKNVSRGITQSPKVGFSQRRKMVKPGTYMTDEFGRRLMQMPDGTIRAETSLEREARFAAIKARNELPCECGHSMKTHSWKDLSKTSTTCSEDGCECSMFRKHED